MFKQDLIFAIDKAEGVIFNLPEVLIYGLIGLVATASNRQRLTQKINLTVGLLLSLLNQKSKTKINHDVTTDFIEIRTILSRIKLFFK